MRKNLFRLALALCLACPVLVQAAPPFPATTSGNTTSYGEGTYSDATYAAAAVVTTAAGAIVFEYRTQIATAAGAAFSVIPRANLSTSAMAAAARHCLVNVACYGTAAAAAALGVIAAHYGYGFDVDPVTKAPKVTTTSTLNRYCIFTGVNQCGMASSPAAFCGVVGGSVWREVGGTTYCAPWQNPVSQDGPTSSETKEVPIEDIVNSIGSDTSNPANLIDSKKTIINEAAKTGYSVPLGRPTTIDVPKSTITSSPTYADLGGGKTKTTTKTTSLTCTPPDCVAIETTIEQVKDLGVGTTTTTTTETPADVVQDVPLSDVPKLYKRKYENGIVGVWTEKKAQLSSSGLGSLLQAMMPNIGSSGGCPVFSIPAKIGPLSFGSGFSGPPCYIWEFCKVVVLLGAAFLARALVFGG